MPHRRATDRALDASAPYTGGKDRNNDEEPPNTPFASQRGQPAKPFTRKLQSRVLYELLL